MFQFKMTSGKFRILNNVVGTRANCVKPHKFDHRYACGANTRCQISYYLPKRLIDEEPSDVLRVLFNYIKSLKSLWILVKLVLTGISSARDVYRRDQLSNKLIF